MGRACEVRPTSAEWAIVGIGKEMRAKEGMSDEEITARTIRIESDAHWIIRLLDYSEIRLPGRTSAPGARNKNTEGLV
jgi:hypothetical protein